MKKIYLFYAVFIVAFVGSLSVQAQTNFTVLIHLKDSATVMAANPQNVGTSTVYTDLNTAIANAQVVINNAGATVTEVADQETAMKAAITNVYGAILLQTRITTWTKYPYAATYVVSNPSFESDLSIGWTSIGGLGRATNANIGAFKAGTYYLEKWVGSPGTQSNINLSQVLKNVPNGIYKVTAAAQAVQQTNPVTYPGKAYVFANADSVEVFALNNYSVQTIVTNNTLNIGYAVKTTGNWVSTDNFLVSYLGTGPKSVLKSALDSANVMVANPVIVGSTTAYPNLNTAVAAAQLVYDNVAATTTEIADQVTALNDAIAAVHVAILLQTRINTWTTFPYNATSVIVNPSFESDIAIGWTNVGGFGRQANTSFAKKVGTNYAEKWITAGTALSNIKLSQTINNIPNGIYLLKASAHAIQQTGTIYPGGAFIYANNDSTEVFAINDYSVTTTVTNNSMNIGFVVKTTGNWVAMDNFQLSYVSDGSPYLIITPTTLSFGPNTTQQTVNVKGGALTADVTLSATSAFSLSKTSITAAEAMATGGVNVVLTSSATGALPNDSLIITSGTARQKVLLTVAETLAVSNKGYFFDQSIVSPFTLTVSGDLYGNTVLTAPAGITLSESTITPVEAQTGKAITVTWNQSSRIVDQYIYLTSGSKKDSVLVFAVNDNIISTWDGDNAIVAPSKLTDFGWSQTLADGVTAGPASFQEYNTGGVRYVTAANAAHTYRGKTWVGYRVAYLRTWGNPAANVFNLAVNLEADKTYVFRGVSAWHNNETNPTFTYAVNTAKSNTGTSLGAMSVVCTVKQRGEDYGFEFTPTTTATHYLTVSSSAINDAMCGVDYLAIYPKVQIISGLGRTENQLLSNAYAYAINGTLKVTGADSYVVYNVQGMKVADVKVNAANTSVSLKPGVYMVRTAGNVQKVLVK